MLHKIEMRVIFQQVQQAGSRRELQAAEGVLFLGVPGHERLRVAARPSQVLRSADG